MKKHDVVTVFAGTEEEYEILIRKTGLDRYVITRLQKIESLPANLADLCDSDVIFLKKYKKLFGTIEFVEMQLARLNREKRLALITTADDYIYCRWERWLLIRFTDMYFKRMKDENPFLTEEKRKLRREFIYKCIFDQLRKYFGINPGAKKIRIDQLRKIAYRRAQKQFENMG